MYSTVTSCAMVGVEPRPVHIETSVAGGRGIFTIVGLPDAAVRESRERVRAAIRHQGFQFPRGRVLVNLSPADIPKQGSTYDLPIALSILSAAFTEPLSFDQFVAVGELSLQGDVKPVRAALGALDVARRAGKACLMSHLSTIGDPGDAGVAGIASLAEAVAVAKGGATPRALETSEPPKPDPMDLAMVRGQRDARRALEIAAAGGHHLLLSGSPGAGKTLLARCLPSILPPLSGREEREVALIWSTAGLDRPSGNHPPFRAPHHSASLPALVGGGMGVPSAGEVTKAHRGVLFLDELGEFAPATLDALRQPIEDGVVTVARSGATIRFPASFQLVASTNPCPCGYLGDRRQPCTCTDARLDRYRQRLSGPLVDRFDLRVSVHRMRVAEMRGPGGETSADVRRRVLVARNIQSQRGQLNSQMSGRALDDQPMTEPAERVLVAACDDRAVTGRGWDRIRRVARTIADLESADTISESHMAEAVEFRQEAA
ncbi:MAG: YifB family Mg chelatase-like AAA ATPase [Acidimicrobiia bacterium]